MFLTLPTQDVEKGRHHSVPLPSAAGVFKASYSTIDKKIRDLVSWPWNALELVVLIEFNVYIFYYHQYRYKSKTKISFTKLITKHNIAAYR